VPDEAAEGGPAIPDILDQASLWAAAGVSFGSTETYRIYLAVKKLAETLPAGHEALRLWGRVTCRNGQYLVVEGEARDEELGEFEETKMEVFQNCLVYFLR
jgi:radial spoke head protein 4/6